MYQCDPPRASIPFAITAVLGWKLNTRSHVPDFLEIPLITIMASESVTSTLSYQKVSFSYHNNWVYSYYYQWILPIALLDAFLEILPRQRQRARETERLVKTSKLGQSDYLSRSFVFNISYSVLKIHMGTNIPTYINIFVEIFIVSDETENNIRHEVNEYNGLA